MTIIFFTNDALLQNQPVIDLKYTFSWSLRCIHRVWWKCFKCWLKVSIFKVDDESIQKKKVELVNWSIGKGEINIRVIWGYADDSNMFISVHIRDGHKAKVVLENQPSSFRVVLGNKEMFFILTHSLLSLLSWLRLPEHWFIQDIGVNIRTNVTWCQGYTVCKCPGNCHALKFLRSTNNESNKGVFIIAFLQGFIHPCWCALSMAKNGQSFIVRGHRNPCMVR